MFAKREKMFMVLMLVALIAIVVVSCGKKGTLAPLTPPSIFITSYEGVDTENDAIQTDPYYYQKRIFWRGESNGGIVDGYAYRVLDIDENPFQTPKTFVDAEGWIYHYKPGADQSIPLTDPEVRTIWTKKVSDVINFPAGVNGDSTNVVSIFEVKCKDNYDNKSSIARKYFNVLSHVPDLDIIFSDRFRPLAAASPDLENPLFKTVGLGFEVEFELTETTPFVQPPNLPNYYMFRMEKRNIATGQIIEQKPSADPNDWFDTKGQSNVKRLWLALEDDNPADFIGRDDVFFVLSADEFTNNSTTSPVTETVMHVKGVNMANVHSVTKTVKFRVYENFRPQALVYRRRTNVLGKNHFVPFQDASVARPLPETSTPEGVQFGTPFFIDKEGRLAALWSDDIRIYLNWGWKGQFVNNDPDLGFVNEVHDETTGIDYLGTVKAFDLRLDGAPYSYPPLQDHPDYETKYRFVDPVDNKVWLRVPRYHQIDTRALLTDITPGDHTFEVRVLDSQNRTSNPQEFKFFIAQPVSADQKSGILIVDNDKYLPSGPLALDEPTNEFYDYILSDFGGTVARLDRAQLRADVWDSQLHYGRDVLSPTDLEQYKLIIWHSDFVTSVGDDNTNFHQEYEVVNLYLRNGGNILISTGQNLKNIHIESYNQPFFNNTLEKYFGIPYFELDAVKRVSTQFTQNAFFIGAEPTAANNFNAISLNPSFHPVVNNFQALAPVAYFDDALITDVYTQVIYEMNATDAGAAFQGVPVAVRRKAPGNTTYLFGFPLSYMDQDDVKTMMNKILSDLGL